jgi:hypothetical protein
MVGQKGEDIDNTTEVGAADELAFKSRVTSLDLHVTNLCRRHSEPSSKPPTQHMTSHNTTVEYSILQYSTVSTVQ